MAKKNSTLAFRDIVLGAEADVIRQALEARLQIDQLIQERLQAYERIAALETQIEDVLGETGVFPFPSPPLPVAGFDPKAETVSRAASAAPGRKAGPRASAGGTAAPAPAATSTPDDADDADTESDGDDKPSAQA